MRIAIEDPYAAMLAKVRNAEVRQMGERRYCDAKIDLGGEYDWDTVYSCELLEGHDGSHFWSDTVVGPDRVQAFTLTWCAESEVDLDG